MSFFFAVVYLIIEYMRPQSMYQALSNLPLAQFAVLGLTISFLFERRERFNHNFQNTFLLVYLFCFFISYLLAFKQDLAWQALTDFGKWVIIYFLLINTINDKRKLYFFVIALLILYFKYAQFATRLWVSNGFYSDPRGLNAGGGIGAGFFQNPNDFGAAINSIIGISFFMIGADFRKVKGWFNMRWFHIICALSLVIAILASSSRGATLGLAVTMLSLWYKSQKKILAMILIAIASIAFIALIPSDNWARFQKIDTEEDTTGQARLGLWRAGVRMANEYPITGVGPNNFVFVNTHLYNSNNPQVQHNVYVQAASELGYPGFVLFLGMILGCFYNQKKAREILEKNQIDDPILKGISHGLDISLIGFLVNGFFITVLYYPFFWMLLMLSTALIDVVKHLSADFQERRILVPVLNQH